MAGWRAQHPPVANAVQRRVREDRVEHGGVEHASLREDYLNQVQRDFLSRALQRNTPSECALKGAVRILAAGPRQMAGRTYPQQTVQLAAGGGVLQLHRLAAG
jgi:hypothetical protein